MEVIRAAGEWKCRKPMSREVCAESRGKNSKIAQVSRAGREEELES